jgi:aldehyde:ferredoxin oxidoreductase
MKAAQRIGGGATELAVHLGKGNPPHGHDPRGVWAVLFNQAVTDTGSIQGGFALPIWAPTWDAEAMPKTGRDSVIRSQLVDCLVICNFTAVGLRMMTEGLSAATGWEFSPADGLLVGERTVNLFRLFNIRQGLVPELETASARLMQPPADGPNAGKTLAPEFDRMLRGYYREMGWDENTGKPLAETLERLGITER